MLLQKIYIALSAIDMDKFTDNPELIGPSNGSARGSFQKRVT
jgi:hypothetical protein